MKQNFWIGFEKQAAIKVPKAPTMTGVPSLAERRANPIVYTNPRAKNVTFHPGEGIPHPPEKKILKFEGKPLFKKKQF